MHAYVHMWKVKIIGAEINQCEESHTPFLMEMNII